MAEPHKQVLEENRMPLVRTVDPDPFLDYLRNHHVLSEDDCQVVQNHYVNRTRRERMRCFIDILMTKGPYGVEVFMKQLGWEYPHVYREIFHKDPEPPPQSYKQDQKSRLSCGLDHILKTGLNLRLIHLENDKLADQVREMEAMLKHQCCEIDDLDRENQRLRQYEKDNQQIQEQLRAVRANNDEIKEENRQFLHEIRTLTLELKKSRDQEAALQAQLDEVIEKMQEKSFEINRISKEESELRAKFERVRNESLKFQMTMTHPHKRRPPILPMDRLEQDELKQRVESLTDEMKNLEDTNKGLCEQVTYMQNIVDDERAERDQMYRRMCTLERDKDNIEARLNISIQKTERYFNKIIELEGQKAKLEEERMHMQFKCWEVNQKNEKQFEDIHKLENRYDRLQQDYDQFRQDHRYCVPLNSELQAYSPHGFSEASTGVVGQYSSENGIAASCRISHDISEDAMQNLIKQKTLSATIPACSDTGSQMGPQNVHRDVSDSSVPLRSLPSARTAARLFLSPHLGQSDVTYDSELQNSQLPADPERSPSLKVHVSSSMHNKIIHQNKKAVSEDISGTIVNAGDLISDEKVDSDFEADDKSSISSGSTCNSSIFDPVDLGEGSGNFFIRVNNIDGPVPFTEGFSMKEGDIFHVQEISDDRWQAMKVDKITGKLLTDQNGLIPNMDRVRRESNSSQTMQPSPVEKSNSLVRKGAVRRVVQRNDSRTGAYTFVTPTKASQPVPVLLIAPQSANTQLLEFVKEKTSDWTNVISDTEGSTMSSAQFLETIDNKYNVLLWECRPKDNNCTTLYKCIIIIITLQSGEAISTLRNILNKDDFQMDYKHELEKMGENLEFIQKCGFHFETVTIRPDDLDGNMFLNELKMKVMQVQKQVFWLEALPRT